MARAFLIMAVFIGVFASVLGSGMSVVPQVSRARPTQPIEVAPQGEETQAEQLNLQKGTLVLDRNANGHFYADVDINGAKVHALVDTGASGIALSREDARNAGLATSIGMPNVVGMGADGEVRGEVVTLDRVSLGSANAESVPAIVLNAGEQSLLGQSFLSHFESVEIRGDQMVLK